jgi:hypothetical protein
MIVRILHSATQSFRSMDCTSKLIHYVFEPKFSCACTKAEIIVLNVLTLFALSELQFNTQKANFISLNKMCEQCKYRR